MSQWINYHHLFYFKVIAEEGSVSKAATRLRLGQPTLSAQLKQFEENLGVSLFVRQHKKLVLTEQGQVALDYARNIFKMGAEMYEVLHDRFIPQKTSITIGTLDIVSKQVVFQLVKQAYSTGDCMVTLAEGKSDELLRELLAHRVDVLVTNFLPSGTDAKGLSHRLFTKKNVAVYGAPKFKHLKKGFPKSISGQPLIVPTYDSKLRYDLDHWSANNGVNLNVIAESQDIGVKILMAVGGLGLITTAAHTVTRQLADGELVEIGELSGTYEELFLVMARRKLENKLAATLFRNFSI